MCTFLSTLPKKSKTQGTNKRRNLSLGLRSCPDKDGQTSWYRVRLLNFSSKTCNRDFPFIARYVHQKWGVSEKGFPTVLDEVVCPVTKFVDWEGDRYDCPICKYAQQQYSALRESNWKDADARKKNREWSRKFQGIVPVYVVDDPNYEGNNGKFRVLIFNNKAPSKKDIESPTFNKYNYYDEFVKIVEKQLLKANCFNGVNAVDCCIHVSMVKHVNNEGQPNEYRWESKEIDKITFLKAEKAYDIPQITREAVDAFPFDDEYYVSSTIDELRAFYDKYIKVAAVSSADIDDSDDEVRVYDAPKAEAVAKTNAVKTDSVLENAETPALTANNDVSTDELDDILGETEEKTESKIPAPVQMKTEAEKLDEESVDDLLAGIDL